MAVSNAREDFIDFLRQFRPLYGPARWLYRTARTAPRNLLRALLPATRHFNYPRGFYSGVALVRSGAAEGRIVAERQNPPRFEPGTLVRRSGLAHDGHQPWPIFWLHEKNAYLSGPSLCLRDKAGRLMAESTFSQTGTDEDPAYWHFAGPPRLKIEGNATSIVSRWGNGVYFHWLFDAVARLALLPEFPADTRILVPTLHPWRAWWIEALGLRDRCVETEATAVTVESYYFAGPSSMTGCWNPFALDFLRRSFLPKAASRGNLPRRFYVLREGFTRGIHNEAEVREFFTRRGWGLVAPEKLPVPEQLELFTRAEAIVAMHGSALTNLAWCTAGCRVCELAPENFLAGAFEVLAREIGLPHDYLVCPSDHRTHIHVDLGLLEKKLAALGV